MSNSHEKDVFLTQKITNKDIYKKLVDIEKKQDQTNGRVKRALWIGSTALSIALIAIGFLFQHINK